MLKDIKNRKHLSVAAVSIRARIVENEFDDMVTTREPCYNVKQQSGHLMIEYIILERARS